MKTATEWYEEIFHHTKHIPTHKRVWIDTFKKIQDDVCQHNGITVETKEDCTIHFNGVSITYKNGIRQ